MNRFDLFAIASASSFLALILAYYLGSLMFLLVDSNYHDGVAAVGGLLLGLLVAAWVFRVVWKRLSHHTNTQRW